MLAVLAALTAALFATGAGLHSLVVGAAAKPAAVQAAPWHLELVHLPPQAPISGARVNELNELAEASRAAAERQSRILPPGPVSEQGMQVKTILVERNIHAAFPQIQEMGGVRPDPLPWHPLGLAVDLMIPDAGSDAGIALGNQIVQYVLSNAERFDVQDAIWRGEYYTPGGGRQSGGYGHYDHVHVTTHGGGYPTGGEVYLR
jgi:hypothetical protein